MDKWTKKETPNPKVGLSDKVNYVVDAHRQLGIVLKDILHSI